jgi:arsenate reductase (glutaredoxin)
MQLTLWHNPRCGKSREALKLLEEKGVDATVVKYLENTPSKEEIQSVLSKLGISARELMRTKEALYKELNLKEETDEEKLIEAMVNNPKLIERPVLITSTQAIIGRPPQKVLDIL